MEKNENSQEGRVRNVQTILIREQRYKSNGMGTSGFILALLGLLLAWVPVAGWILWLLGGIFSLIGLFKSPRGLAITGLVLTLITLAIGALFMELISSAFK